MTTRRVNPWAQLTTVFGMFIAGGFIGWGLSSWAAPRSGLAAGISGMLLPTAFVGGLLIWAGLDIVTAIVDLLRGRRHRPSSSDLATRSASWFVPVSLAVTCAGGLLVGILPGGQGPLLSTLAYGATGTAYGLAMGRLAASGYLPAPHSD
ncbi:MAG TPA: hypothetical protein VIK60_04510 [Vicinamibacterales bacterium]